MGDQGTLFETPKERSSREHNEALTAYMEARRVESGYQCQDCGGISPNQARDWADHGLMGSRCQAERFARNQTIYDFRNGDRDRYIGASRRLRLIAAWRSTNRTTNGKKDTP